MEALVILLAEFLSGPIIALVAVLANVTILILSFLFELTTLLLFSRQRKKAEPTKTSPSDKASAIRLPPLLARRIRQVSLASLALILVLFLAVNFVFFDPATRWLMARVGQRTQTELSFASVSGNLFTGQFVFEDMTASRHSDVKSSFNLNAKRVDADIDLSTLIFRPIVLESLAVETVRGNMSQPDKRKESKAARDLRIKARRIFNVTQLQLSDVDIALSKADNPPIQVTLDTVESAPFRSNYAVFDVLFRSNVAGRIDGHDLSISTEQIPSGRVTSWRIPTLPVDTVSRFVTKPPIGWLQNGTINVKVDDRWQLDGKANITMDWDMQMRGVRVEASKEAGLIEKTIALPLASYINARNGDVDLRFKLIMNEGRFENMTSLDASGIWDAIVNIMAKTIAGYTQTRTDDVKQRFDKTVKGFKNFLNRRRQPSDAD